MKKESGQSLIELLIAMFIFVATVTVATFLMLDVFLSDRMGREKTVATFLAKEGMEAVRSIRDNNWDDLIGGNYGLVLLSNKWVFQGSEEDINNHLKNGVRKITIEDVGEDRKKITSRITWEINEGRNQEVKLVTYLTNWLKTEGVPPIEENQAEFLVIDISGAKTEKGDKSLAGITISNSAELNIIIDKITVHWNNDSLISEIKINKTTVWSKTGPGTPTGAQPFGVELDIEDFILEPGMTYDIDSFRFLNPMTGVTFNINFLMGDGTSTSTGEFNP